MSHDIDRDTCKFAFKASNIVIDGREEGICKEPITDPGKRSKRGRLALVKENDSYNTIRLFNGGYLGDQLREVYRNGKLLVNDSWDTIKARIN